jgi:CTP-dependent riboflavin kinase
MPQLDNLDITLRRLREEAGWSHKKESKFIIWLNENNHIQKGQRPGSRAVEDLFKKIKDFESLYQYDQDG